MTNSPEAQRLALQGRVPLKATEKPGGTMPDTTPPESLDDSTGGLPQVGDADALSDHRMARSD